MRGKILVGTSSWSDPGFIADWYPKRLPASERLPYYAARFNLVEVNSSFYAIPSPDSVSRWCEQTPPHFVFDVKLHRLLSRHSTQAKFLPAELRTGAEVIKDRVVLTPTLERQVVRKFLKSIQPFQECGKLGILLLQLSPSFRPKTNDLRELDHLFELLSGYRIAVEFRNRDWVEAGQFDRLAEYLEARRVAFVGVDAPESAHFMVMPGVDVLTNPDFAYLRMHGRNAEGYVRGRTVAERFDYEYSPKELKELAHRAVKLTKGGAVVHVLYNNNASDYALEAATTFQKILEDDYPEEAVPTGGETGEPTRGAWGKTGKLDLGDFGNRRKGSRRTASAKASTA
jgi:uncharacterized protein YecE (DUF72 family)